MESSLETEAGGEGRCWVQLVVEKGSRVTASASTGCWSHLWDPGPQVTGVLLLGSLFRGSRPAPSWGASGAPGGSSPGGLGSRGHLLCVICILCWVAR